MTRGISANIRLGRDFFTRDTITVAKDLIGKTFAYGGKNAVIMETEAYRQDEAACHAFIGRTKRNLAMFGKAGTVYMFSLYGFSMLNFVTEEEGFGAGVLIRGGIVDGTYYDGPGKLTRALGIGLDLNFIDAVDSDVFRVYNTENTYEYQITKRIGITKATDLLWRFVVPKKALPNTSHSVLVDLVAN
jgi:DNA-3-methyladenine glycosylase